MDNFLKQSDALAKKINEKANLLYNKFTLLSADQLDLSEYGIQYFQQHHSSRLFFSIQTSAELLYRSIKLKGGTLSDLVIMDYGAGIGSMFLLAKLIGAGLVVYNDYNPINLKAGKSLCDALDIPVDYFIVGDHTQTFQTLKEKKINCDIILSRNVVEHIYDLNDFYNQARQLQSQALIYFSTTANYHNPANRLYHQKIHNQYEKGFLEKRKEIIKTLQPGAHEEEIAALATATRGLAMEDLEKAVRAYFTTKELPEPSIHYSNTANPENGIWAEHVIKKQDYKNIIEPLGYHVSVIPAFWDTHYKKFYKRWLGKTMNLMTRLFGEERGLWFTAFIYIIARPVDQ
jgi:2-polyprenyl-3-methyl-5-hydroxy-6-metoxy-1,4-benzoquinol methylase